MDREKAHTVLHELSRKLILLRTERKSIRRKEIIDSILLGEQGELKQLKELLRLKTE